MINGTSLYLEKKKHTWIGIPVLLPHRFHEVHSLRKKKKIKKIEHVLNWKASTDSHEISYAKLISFSAFAHKISAW